MVDLNEKIIKKARVLVVEDDAAMLELIVQILESIGINSIVVASDGIEAWRKFQDGDQFDLVICDWVMPGMDGLDVLRNIRAGSHAIPFILVTVHDSVEAIKEATSSGVTAFISKPFKAEDIVLEVYRVLADSDGSKDKGDPSVWEI